MILSLLHFKQDVRQRDQSCGFFNRRSPFILPSPLQRFKSLIVCSVSRPSSAGCTGQKVSGLNAGLFDSLSSNGQNKKRDRGTLVGEDLRPEHADTTDTLEESRQRPSKKRSSHSSRESRERHGVDHQSRHSRSKKDSEHSISPPKSPASHVRPPASHVQPPGIRQSSLAPTLSDPSKSAKRALPAHLQEFCRSLQTLLQARLTHAKQAENHGTESYLVKGSAALDTLHATERALLKLRVRLEALQAQREPKVQTVPSEEGSASLQMDESTVSTERKEAQVIVEGFLEWLQAYVLDSATGILKGFREGDWVRRGSSVVCGGFNVDKYFKSSSVLCVFKHRHIKTSCLWVEMLLSGYITNGRDQPNRLLRR